MDKNNHKTEESQPQKKGDHHREDIKRKKRRSPRTVVKAQQRSKIKERLKAARSRGKKDCLFAIFLRFQSG